MGTRRESRSTIQVILEVIPEVNSEATSEASESSTRRTSCHSNDTIRMLQPYGVANSSTWSGSWTCWTSLPDGKKLAAKSKSLPFSIDPKSLWQTSAF